MRSLSQTARLSLERLLSAVHPRGKPCGSHNYRRGTDAVSGEWGETEPFGSHTDVGGADAGHEQGRNERNPIRFLLLRQVYGYGPEGEYGEGLVAPGKVAPDNLESIGIGQAIDECGHSDQEQGNADEQPALDAALLHVQEVGQNEACRTQGCVATCDGGGHDAEQCHDASYGTQPIF